MRCHSIAHEAVHPLSVLFCSGGAARGEGPESVTRVASPLECLSAATQRLYDLVVLCLEDNSPVAVSPLMELCTALKNNRHTFSIPLAVVCACGSRRIIENLERVGVDYVTLRKSPNDVGGISDGAFSARMMDEAHRPARILEGLCPYIHNGPISDANMLTTCQAYANWLVLGARRLRELCQTPRFTFCPYYRHPKHPH